MGVSQNWGTPIDSRFPSNPNPKKAKRGGGGRRWGGTPNRPESTTKRSAGFSPPRLELPRLPFAVGTARGSEAPAASLTNPFAGVPSEGSWGYLPNLVHVFWSNGQTCGAFQSFQTWLAHNHMVDHVCIGYNCWFFCFSFSRSLSSGKGVPQKAEGRGLAESDLTQG